MRLSDWSSDVCSSDLADALALAAGKAAGAAAERQVVEPDVDQEAQALVDLLQDARRDLLLLWPELAVKGGEPGSGVGDRELRDLADVQAVELHRQGLRLQAVAVADVAGLVALVLGEVVAAPVAVGLPHAPLHVRDHALEGLRGLVFPQAVLVGHGDLGLAGAVEDRKSGV